MDSAERAYARALELNPDNPEAAHGLGTIRMKKRDYAGAETLYKKVLAAWPDDPNALVNLGNIRFYRQDPYGAGDFYSRALAADPRSPIAAENVRGITETVARFEAGKMAADPGGFLDGLERSARADPANGFLFGRTLALLEKQGWNGRALDLVALRLKVRPDDPMARDARTRLAGR